MTLIAYQHITRSKAVHFRVEQSLYSETMKYKLQRVGSPARWVGEKSAWDFPTTPAALVALAKVARETGETIEWRDGLKEFAEAHLKQSDAEHQVRLAMERIIRDKPPLDAYVTRMTQIKEGVEVPCPPLYHQQVDYHWSQRVSGLLMAEDPGVGKSRGATDASGGWYRNGLIEPMSPAVHDGQWGVQGGVLVVCPKSVMKTWQFELSHWQNASSILIRGEPTKKKRLAATPTHYHVCNYDGLKFVAHNRYGGIIFDECHKLSNNTNRTQFSLTLASRAKKKLGLSGTPIANSLESIFYPLLILDGGKALGASKTAFLEKFFRAEHRGQFVKNIPNEGAAQAIAAAMAESTHFVTKEEVLPFLPKKTHTPLYLEMTADQERYYNTLKNEAVAYIQDAEVTVEQASARMMKLLQVCQGFVLADDRQGRPFNNVKTDTLFEMLTDTLSGRKVIVWCYFKYEIAQVIAGLRARGIKAVHVDGDVSQRQRDADAHNWNHDPSITVFVRQLGMSEGETLIGNESGVPCYDNIYCGLSYNYIEWKQSQDRIHRIGQNHPCSYTYLLTENGIDKAVYENVLQKDSTAQFVHKEGKDYYLNLLRAA